MRFITAGDVVLKNGAYQERIELGDAAFTVSIVCALGRYLCWASDRHDVFWTNRFDKVIDWLYDIQGCKPQQHLVIRMDEGWVLDTPEVFKTERHALDYVSKQAKETNGNYAVIPVLGFRIVDDLQYVEDEE